MAATASKLIPLLRMLKAEYGAQSPPPATNAFELVVWEKVAYLTTDERRREAFDRLARNVGLTPESILAAKRSTLLDLLATGGIGAPERTNNLVAAAEFVVGEFDGDLDAVCSRPLADAKRQLKRIYGIADPGAEKILLFTRKHPVMGLDSNGLRVLTRLGFGVAAKTYGATYKSATEAVTPEFRGNIGAMIDANLLLRHHGQTVCKTTRPHCGACVLRAQCPSAKPSS